MKRIIATITILFACMLAYSAPAVDPARDAALAQFDDEVNGGTKLVDTVQPLTKDEIDEATEPFWDDWFDWGPDWEWRRD